MKLRNMLFGIGFILAIGANFAFTSAKMQYPSYGYYYNAIQGRACEYGQLNQTDCSPGGVGAKCTIYGETGYVQAYESYKSTYVCELALYQTGI